MSKRTAQGPQGNRDAGINFNMSSTPDDKPQRATAAQMANRKIKQISSRRRTAPAAASTTQQQFSPFNSLEPNTFSNTSATQPGGAMNGFTFGQSQSFPGAGSNPGQPMQNGTPFSFGSGGSASTFNFSTSFDSSSSVNNPFANMGGSGTNQTSGETGFTGFQGSMFNIPPSGNQVQNQPFTPSTGLFGSQPQQTPSGSVFGGFGGNTPATSGPLFQFSPATPASTGNIFGQTTTQTAAPASNLFGQMTVETPSLFGQSTTFDGTPQNQNLFGADADSMQTSPDGKKDATTPRSSIFGNTSTSQSFGNSTFSTLGQKPLFGITTTDNNTTFSTSQIPSQPLFGPKLAEPSTHTTTAGSSLFGRVTQPDASSQTALATGAATPATTAAASTSATASLFGTMTPTTSGTTFQNPFQTSNLFASASKPSTQPAPASTPFGASNLFAPKPAQDTQEAEQKPSDTTGAVESNKAEDVAKLATPGTPLFSKADDNAATPTAQTPSSTTLFGNKPTFSAPQQPSSTNLFAPKPASTPAQDASQPIQGNPFSGLFALKPSTPAASTPEKPPIFQAPAPSTNLFTPKTTTAEAGGATQTTQETSGSKFSFEAAATAGETAKQTTSTTSSTSLFASPKPAPIINGQDALKTDKKPSETDKAVTTVSTTEADKTLAPKAPFGARGPRGLPANLSKGLRDDVELLYRVRMLNECFQRKISELDPSKDDFDVVVLFYMRVRETIGAPTGGFRTTTSKRKVREDEADRAEAGTPLQKKTKPAEPASAATTPNGPAAAGKTDKAAPTPNPFSSTTFKPFETTPTSTPSNKRKAVEDEETPTGRAVESGKRARNEEESATANIFASSFSSSKDPDSAKKESTPQTPSLFKPSTSDSSKATASPAVSTPTLFKPTFTAAESKESASTSSPATSTPLFKPAAESSGTSVNGTPAKSPFTFKPPTADKSTASPAKPAFEVPKFGGGAVTTNFFSQFKAQAEKDAEKEKLKRKAEEFDSDEDDEAEWERKDAEERRRKREKLESFAKKRSVFVPGKGFVFEDEAEEAPADKPSVSAAPSASTTGSSIFSNAETKSPAKSNNPFSNLSATTSEADKDNHDETESTDRDDQKDDESKDREESSIEEAGDEAEQKASTGDGEESSDDGDITKALEKKSKEAAAAKKAASDVESAEESGAATAGGRSLFDRIQYDQDGKPKREAQEAEEKKDSGNPFASIFGNTKFASFNGTPSPSTFTPTSRPSSSHDNATPSTLSPSVNTTGGLFTSSKPPASGSTSGSIFAPSKPGVTSDNTWNPNSPIRFGTTTAATPPSSTSTAKPDASSASPAAGSSKPFSTLFGGQTGSTSQTTASGSQQTGLGFNFGAPAQPAASNLAPSTGVSADASRSTTPGVTSDTGADESGDGDAAPNDPQLNLAQSRAGEEEEDIVMETRARALKLVPGAGWESQGVGVLRILKHQKTSRSRVILRADPSGKVVLNASLMKQIKYTASGNNVQFLVPKAEGAPEQWALRVKKEEVSRLVTTMEESKA
ncbi:hypothetical protein VTN02DRAFT_5900 [Thermoascus thermophilus]